MTAILRGRHQAQPAADAGEHARPHPLRAVRQHRHRQLLGHRRPDRHQVPRLPASPRRASVPTWAPSASSTSSAGSSGLRPDAAVARRHRARAEDALGSLPGRRRQAAAPGDARGEPRGRPARRCPTWLATSRSSGASACHRSSRSTPSPPTTTSEHEVIRASARSGSASGSPSPATSPRAGRGRWSWPQLVVEAAQEPTSLPVPLPPRPAARREDRGDRATQIYGADGIDLSPAGASLRRLRAARATAGCPWSSPRPTCRSRRTRPCAAPRPAGGCRCARSARRSAPATSTPSAATCAPCRACRAPPAERIDIDEDGNIVGLS